MKPPFGSIWLEPTPLKLSMPWRVQMMNYIAEFPTEEAARKYVAAIIKDAAIRERGGFGQVSES